MFALFSLPSIYLAYRMHVESEAIEESSQEERYELMGSGIRTDVPGGDARRREVSD